MPSKTIGAVALGAILGVLGGASATWALMRKQANHEIRSVALAHELEATGLCANALKLIQSNDSAKLSALLRQRLVSALQESSGLVARGACLGGPAPNLLESPRRAALYYSANNEPRQAQAAEQLLQKLTTAR